MADREGVAIPRLCYKEGIDPAGNCRACMVEINGERVLAPSCCRAPAAGMKVTTDSERALDSQKLVLELLLSDMRESDYTLHNELDVWANELAVGKPRFPVARAGRGRPVASGDDGQPRRLHPVHALRARLPRRAGQRRHRPGFPRPRAKIVFDMDDPMGDSTCVACGECVQACPTGALMPARDVALTVPDKQVESVCPYCGVGCQLTYNVKDDKILFVEGRDGPANHGRLCVKGRYGFDYAHHPQRLTKPLIRRADAPPKRGDFDDGPGPGDGRVPRSHLGRGAGVRRRQAARDPRARRPGALAGFGSAKGSNEEAYLFQKLVRTGFGSNNVDHCTRLCHASSVVALLEGIGSGRGVEPGDGREQGRGGDHHRRQSDGEPSGGGDLDEERGQGTAPS